MSIGLYGLCVTAVAVLLYVIISTSLQKTLFFRSRTATIAVALCITALCISGMNGLLSGPSRTAETGGDIPGQILQKTDGVWLKILLLPYTTLAIAILLLVPVVVACQCRGEMRREGLSGAIRRIFARRVGQNPEQEKRSTK
jgi:cobalamin synthase